MQDLTEFERAALDSLAHEEPDWVLAGWVNLANRTGQSFPVTLVVGGSLVVGTIIGGKEYFELLGDQLGEAVGLDDDAENIFRLEVDHYEELYRAEGESDEEEDDEDEKDPPRTAFIHLKDARILHGSQQIPERFEGMLWRGRLASVDGFMVGEARKELAR